mgnify:CR=1 FL=1
MKALQFIFNRLGKKTAQDKKTVCSWYNDSTIVLTQGLSASFDYYIAPQLVSMGSTDFTLLDTRLQAPPLNNVPGNASGQIVISRYLPPHWTPFIKHLHAMGKKIIYFMDDDLYDPDALAELPKTYRQKIYNQAFNQRSFIENVCSEFWVSSAYLAEKYADWSPKLLEPKPTNQEVTQNFWLVYHGTASHVDEFAWLHPIVGQVELSLPCSRFEVFGDHAIYKQFKHLSRVTVIHPMQWSNYLDYTTHVQRDIGLVPLLPSKFNAGRGPTKFFDLTRMGAVGLYSDIKPYSDFIRHEIDGFLLPNDPNIWIDTIMMLHQNPELRKRIVQMAQERMQQLESK